MTVSKDDFIAGFICAGGDADEARRQADQFASCVEAANRVAPPSESEPEEPLVCIWSGEWNQWWRPNSAGYTPDCREAGVYPLSKAQKILAGAGDEKKLEIVNHTPDAHSTPEQTESVSLEAVEQMLSSYGEYPMQETVDEALRLLRQYRRQEPDRQTGDALAVLNWLAKNAGRHVDERSADSQRAIVIEALTASGVPEEVRRLPDRMEADAKEMAARGDHEAAHEIQGWSDEVARALASAPADGYKLVPVEPTQAMIDAADQAVHQKPMTERDGYHGDDNVAAYRAMIEAAPTDGREHD